MDLQCSLFKNPSDILVRENTWHFKSVEVAKLPQGVPCSCCKAGMQSRDAEWHVPDGSGEAAHPYWSFTCKSLKHQTNPEAETSVTALFYWMKSSQPPSAQCTAKGPCPELMLQLPLRSRVGWRVVEKKEGKKVMECISLLSYSCRSWNTASITARGSLQHQKSEHRKQNHRK